jgi:hypothetical protein
MIIRNKFNGYGFDGVRFYHDPVSLSIAATQAGAASSAAAAALAAKTAAATTAATTAATAAAGKTAALELAKKEAISAGMKQAGTEAAKQGIAQAGQQVGVEAAKQTGVEAAKQGIFSANPAGMPPTAGAPITPTAPATPLPPAGGTPFTPPTTAAKPIDPYSQEYLRQTYPEQFAQHAGKTIEPGTAGQGLEQANATQRMLEQPQYLRGTENPLPEVIPPEPVGADAVKAAQASSQQVSQYTPEVPKGISADLPTSALKRGVMEGLEIVKKYPMETGMGLMAAGQYMNKPEKEDEDKYKNTVDMSGFQPSVPTQRPFTRSYEYQSYQGGGPVEDMSRMNSIGANTGFPMARLQTPAYAVSSATPMPVNTLTPSADASVNAYTGEPRFAEGGLSAAQRREYGLQTRGQRAARSLTKSYEEMEEERQKEAMKLFGERSDPGIVPRSRTQMLSSPFSAAQAEHARLGKKAKVPVVEMPKTNLGDIDNYMDIPIEAAGGGIMHGAEKFSNGGPAFMRASGTPSKAESVSSGGPAFMRASGAPSRAEIVSSGGPAFMGPVGSGVYGSGSDSAPDFGGAPYSIPAQQARYTPQPEYAPVPYQNNLPPQQQPDMSDFYANMDQQLASYGYAAGGGIMHGLGGYSDGGRLLRGPGDGVSDSIPAVIGKRQPARLADGEFVVPARIVSELGNGSTEAGARKLYAMMERVQASRKKSIGKKKVAVNSKSDKHLPA